MSSEGAESIAATIRLERANLEHRLARVDGVLIQRIENADNDWVCELARFSRLHDWVTKKIIDIYIYISIYLYIYI